MSSAKRATQLVKEAERAKKQEQFERNKRLQLANRKIADQAKLEQQREALAEKSMELHFLKTDPFPPQYV